MIKMLCWKAFLHEWKNLFVISKIIRIERTTEKPAYVKDNITEEIRHIADNEFKGKKITHYRIILANYFEIGFFIFPLDGELDKIIPFWFWTEKEVVPSKYAEELKNKK